MTDLAPAIAEFLDSVAATLDRHDPMGEGLRLIAAIRARWPGVTDDEISRGNDIWQTTARQRIAELRLMVVGIARGDLSVVPPHLLQLANEFGARPGIESMTPDELTRLWTEAFGPWRGANGR